MNMIFIINEIKYPHDATTRPPVKYSYDATPRPPMKCSPGKKPKLRVSEKCAVRSVFERKPLAIYVLSIRRMHSWTARLSMGWMNMPHALNAMSFKQVFRHIST